MLRYTKALIFVSLTVLAFSIPSLAKAATWYASPTGVPGALGTSEAEATDLVTAVTSLAQDGDTVQLMAGTYNLSDTLRVARAIQMIGAGRGQTIINGSGLAPIENGLLILATNDEFEISQLTFDGFGLSTGIDCNENTRCHIHDMEFIGGQHTAVTSNSVELNVHNTHFANVQGALSINANSVNSSLTIENNTFENIGSGSAVRILSENGNHGVVANNSYIDSAEAIYIWTRNRTPGGEIIITGNNIQRGAAGLKLTGHSQNRSSFANIIFKDNTIDGASNGAIIHYVNDFNFSENTVTESRYKNISLIDSVNIKIGRNRIQGAGESGIDVGGNCINIHMTNNIITENNFAITMWGGSSGKIGYNTLINAVETGIRVYTQETVTIANNIIFGSQQYALWSHSSANPEVCFNNFYQNAAGDFSGPYNDLGDNLFVAPLFKSANDPRLQAGSPLINAGGYYFVETDYMGNRRFGKKGQQKTDIGAMEF